MEDMIIDFDIDDDPIKQFLLHKLEDIKQRNTELEEQINRRKQLRQECTAKMTSEFSENILEVTEVWQRILNGKWIVGIKLRNTSGARVAKNISLVLKWDASIQLTYHITQFRPGKGRSDVIIPEKLSEFIKLFGPRKNLVPLSNEWIKNDEIEDTGFVIFTFDVPNFTASSQYKIAGILTYEVEGKSCSLNLAEIEIKASNVFGGLFTVKGFDVLNGDECAFLSTLVANQEMRCVVRTLENSYTDLENMLEFECRFRKVNVISRWKYLFVSGIADTLDGCLVELDKEAPNIYSLNIFSRDQPTLQLLLHYLYQNIPGVLILPKVFKRNLMEEPIVDKYLSDDQKVEDASVIAKLRQFGGGLEAQITFVENFCMEHIPKLPEDISEVRDEIDLNVEDYQDFRKELAELELNTDLHFLTVDRLTKNSETASEASSQE